jgi:DNA-binding response OmpR family regulator
MRERHHGYRQNSVTGRAPLRYSHFSFAATVTFPRELHIPDGSRHFVRNRSRIWRSEVKLVALFVNKIKQAAVARELEAHGVELAVMQSVGGLLHTLKRGDVQAVLLEDADTQLIDWLAMLQMRMAGVVPVIVVGGGSGLGMAEALAHGATDYAEYTGSIDQLLARLRARVGRSAAPASQYMEVGPYALHAASSAVFRDGVEINLTAREFALAWVLFSSAGRVVSASSLAARVWGRSTDVCKRTLEQHIYRLRRKLCTNGMDSMIRIHAIYSIGYRLDLMTHGRSPGPATDFGIDSRPMGLLPELPPARQGTGTGLWGEL